MAPQPADARNGCSNSCAAVHRSRGSLAKHRAKKSLASGDIQRGASGTASVYPTRSTAAGRPSRSLHGARPVAISTTVQPSAQTSAAGPCPSPRSTSGAMNAGVPPTGRPGSAPPAAALAQPKSASMARPSAPTTTFRALTSPCTTERPWRYARPRATSAAYAATARSSRPLLLAATSASEPPGANSRSSSHPPSAAARRPRQGTTCGDRSADRMLPSRRRLSAARVPAGADLTAKSAPEAASAASDTTAPDAPRPSVRTRVHRQLTGAAVAIGFISFLLFSRRSLVWFE
uniref:Uncharacterized protein n=1 Tax=Zea mays TaxID=4577 RepID=C0P6G3_MAIZE|nr:unknown [Zea mays]